jgi:hypothetical protein
LIAFAKPVLRALKNIFVDFHVVWLMKIQDDIDLLELLVEFFGLLQLRLDVIRLYQGNSRLLLAFL